MTHCLKIFLVFFLVISSQARACECLWQGSFSKSHRQSDLIISGEVIASRGNYADVSVNKIHFDRELNNKEFNTQVRIWGDNGKLCRPKIENFPIGTQWVMALKKITQPIPGGFNPNTPNISYGRINDYYLSKCGANWLNLSEGVVTGNLVQGRRWEWEHKTMNPVMIELIDAYVREVIPEQALIEAAKPLSETKKLMNETKSFLQTQQ
jgi:hypothetical protein